MSYNYIIIVPNCSIIMYDVIKIMLPQYCLCRIKLHPRLIALDTTEVVCWNNIIIYVETQEFIMYFFSLNHISYLPSRNIAVHPYGIHS